MNRVANQATGLPTAEEQVAKETTPHRAHATTANTSAEGRDFRSGSGEQRIGQN
jgi:hypothetical protein